MASISKTTSVSSEYYNPWAEHSQEELVKVKRWEDEEQKRRMVDILGEQQRRYCANQVAEIVSTTLRPSWFQKGTSYVFNILGMARKAGDSLLRSSQVQAMNARIQIAGQKGIATAQNVAHSVEGSIHKAQETSQDVKLKLQEKIGAAQGVAHHGLGKVQETALDVKHKVEVAGHKAQETSQDVKVKLQEKIGVAQDVAHHGLEKVQEVALKLKSVSLKLFGKVNEVWSNLSENTNLAFAVLEEENERAWRLNGETEIFAIINGLTISSLFKEMAPEFYRPTFEPTRKYSTKLIEQYECTRRVTEDLSDRTAVNNAKAVSSLIEAKFRAVAPSAFPPKVEILEEEKPKTPMTAAM